MDEEDVLRNFLTGMENLQVPELQREEEYNMGVFDKFLFDQQIQRINDINDNDAYNLIKDNVEYITTKILRKEWEYPNILITRKYLMAFSRVLRNIPITATVRIATNKICYDYLTSGLDTDENVKSIVIDLSKTVNYNYIQALIGIGLPGEVASILSLSRFSTIDETINIRRLNFSICQQDPEVVTLQRIVWIYEKLFDRVGELFTQTMFEYYSPEEELELGSNFQEIYSTISLAVLTIVNNLPMDKLYLLIRNYISDWEYNGRPPVRFSLISLSADYSRIQNVVEQISLNGDQIP